MSFIQNIPIGVAVTNIPTFLKVIFTFSVMTNFQKLYTNDKYFWNVDNIALKQ